MPGAQPEPAPAARPARPQHTRRISALTAFAIAAWNVGIWVNHWYVAERFLNSQAGGGPEGGDWWAAADLMSSGNRALVTGLCWLGVMASFIAVSTIARRRSRVRATVLDKPSS